MVLYTWINYLAYPIDNFNTLLSLKLKWYICETPFVPTQSDSAPSMALTATVPHVTTPTLSFATALAGTKIQDCSPLPSPCIKGGELSIKFGQEEYRKGVEDCRKVLRARLTLSKGDKPHSARDLRSKINKLWKTKVGWKMVPLGKGYYDFHFESAENFKNIWAVGTVNLKPGLLRFSQWTKDFKLLEQKQTHATRVLARENLVGNCKCRWNTNWYWWAN